MSQAPVPRCPRCHDVLRVGPKGNRRPCDWCGPITVLSRKRYLDLDKVCGYCGAEFKIDVGSGRPRSWCSDACRNNAKSARRRVTHDDRVVPRAQVIARDGMTCYLCGIQCETHPEDIRRRLTIDHVVPVKAGGTNDIWNLRVCCWSCNSRKGARVA